MITDPKNSLTFVQLEPCVARTANLAGTAYDLRSFTGKVVIALHSALGTGNANNTLDVKIQSSATSGGAFTDVTGATFATVTNSALGSYQTISIDTRACGAWIKVIGTVGGTTPSFVYGVSLVGRKQSQP